MSTTSARTHSTTRTPLHLGERLARWRMRKGWSQQELAVRAGTHVSTITRLEGAKGWDTVAWGTVREVARAMGQRVEEFAT